MGSRSNPQMPGEDGRHGVGEINWTIRRGQVLLWAGRSMDGMDVRRELMGCHSWGEEGRFPKDGRRNLSWPISPTFPVASAPNSAPAAGTICISVVSVWHTKHIDGQIFSSFVFETGCIWLELKSANGFENTVWYGLQSGKFILMSPIVDLISDD